MKFVAFIFVVLLTLANAQDASINWYNNNPDAEEFQISTAADLRGLAALVNSSSPINFSGKTIKLASDIELTGNWTPIGNYVSIKRLFRGIFDGQGYTISGLSVNGGDYAGLFGYVGEGGQIKNVNIVAKNIKTATTSEVIIRYAGGLAAVYYSTEPIENCSVKADSIVSRAGFTSGSGGSGSGYSGGLVGYMGVYDSQDITSIINSYASGNITGSGYGYIGSTSCQASSHGYGYGGGLVGRAENLSITNSYASGNIIGYGYAKTNTAVCSNRGYGYGGGLVGSAIGDIFITNCYTSGNIIGSGSNNGYGGGLVGYAGTTSNSTITNSYASGNVTVNANTSYSGGIFGYFSSGTNVSLYYDSAGASLAVGDGPSTGILGVSSDALKEQATFIDWDFDDIWGIDEGVDYPFLKSLPPPPIAESSSSSITLSSSSAEDNSSSSSESTPSSSSENTPSSSSGGETPIRLLQIASSNQATQIHNGINLQVTRNAVVEIYGLDGKLIGKQNFGGGVYNVSLGYLPKGLYIVNASFGSEKKVLKVPVR